MSLTALPFELLDYLLSHVEDPPSLAALRGTCRATREVVEGPRFQTAFWGPAQAGYGDHHALIGHLYTTGRAHVASHIQLVRGVDPQRVRCELAAHARTLGEVERAVERHPELAGGASSALELLVGHGRRKWEFEG